MSEDIQKLNLKTREELIRECVKRRITAEQIWHGINQCFAHVGFIAVLNHTQKKKDLIDILVDKEMETLKHNK